MSALPLPHSRLSTVGTLAGMAQVLDEDTERFCPLIAQPVALLLHYPIQVMGHYPLTLAVEVIFSPVNCSFTQSMCPHLPNKHAEGHGAKGVYKSKCIRSCYSSVVYIKLFQVADSQIGPMCKSMLFVMIFWSLIHGNRLQEDMFQNTSGT